MIKYFLISFLIATSSLIGVNGQDCLSLDITDWSMGPTRYNPSVLKATVENTGTDTLFIADKSIQVFVYKAAEPFNTSRRRGGILLQAGENAPHYLAPGASFILPTFGVNGNDCGFPYTYITFSSESFADGDCQPEGNKFNLFTANPICLDSTMTIYLDTLAIEALGTEPESYRIPLRVSNFKNVGAYQTGLVLDGLPSARFLDFMLEQRFPDSRGNYNIRYEDRDFVLLDYSNSVMAFNAVDSVPLGYLTVEADLSQGDSVSFLFDEAGTATEVTDINFVRRVVRKVPFKYFSLTSGRISGNLLSPTGTPVSGHQVTLSDGTVTLLDTTTMAGGFSFAVSPAVNDAWTVSFAPLPDPQAGQNALSMLDRVILQRHLLGISTISDPLRMFAADFNKDGEIDVQDALMMQRVILGSEAYPSGSGSYRYSAEGTEIDVVISISTGDNIQVQTIRLGDLNLSGL